MAAKISNGKIEKPFTAFETAGRPYAISAAKSDGFCLAVWEERIGKKTKIKISKINEANFEEPAEMTDGTFNAYDRFAVWEMTGKFMSRFVLLNTEITE